MSVQPSSSGAEMHGITDVLRSVRYKGVELWAEKGQLRYRAPKGALTPEEIEKLRVSKGQIIALLEGTAGVGVPEPRTGARSRRDLAPVTFAQLAHLHFFQLHGERYAGRSARAVWSAMRLHGALNIGVLRKSIAEVIRRHDALRTRIGLCDGILMQKISESCDFELQFVDLTEVPEDSRENEVEQIIEQFVLEPIDMADDDLLALRLLRLRDDEHVLMVATDHMISDGTSVNILVREILAAYVQVSQGLPVSLPPVSMQFSDYAAWQASMGEAWIEKHDAYWKEHLAGCPRVRFPEDRAPLLKTHLGWGAVPVRIGRELKAELIEWCRARKTTLVMSAFTAYAGLVLRWCATPECVIQYRFNGRVIPQIENTIGFFASPLYLRSRLGDADSLVDLLHASTEEYCQAYEHADFFYMASQVPPPEFTRNPIFNWTPLGSKLDLSEFDGLDGAIRCTPMRIADPVRKILTVDHEPIIRLCDAEDEITGYVFFPLDRFSPAVMERFVRNFHLFMASLIKRPDQPVKGIQLVQ